MTRVLLTTLRRGPAAPGAADVLALNDVDAGVVAILRRPGLAENHQGVQLNDLLHALGTPLARPNKGSPSLVGLRAQTVGRLRAHSVRFVVAAAAGVAPQGHLDQLLDVATASGSDLVLVADPGASDRSTAFGDAHAGTQVDWATILGLLPPPSKTAAPRVTAAELREVPKVPYPFFRAALRDTLPADQFDIADHLYRHAYRATRHAVAPVSDNRSAHEVVRGLLIELWADTRTTAEALVVTRAAQAAAISRGVHVLVETALLHADFEKFGGVRLDPRQLRSLRVLDDLGSAAAVALFDARVALGTVLDLRVSDVGEDRTLLGAAGTLAADAKIILVARRWELLELGHAQDDHLLFPCRAKRHRLVGEVVRRAAADIDVELPVSAVWNRSRHRNAPLGATATRVQ